MQQLHKSQLVTVYHKAALAVGTHSTTASPTQLHAGLQGPLHNNKQRLLVHVIGVGKRNIACFTSGKLLVCVDMMDCKDTKLAYAKYANTAPVDMTHTGSQALLLLSNTSTCRFGKLLLV